MLNRAKPKSRFCSFRLTEEEYLTLSKVAQFERRKMADFVHLVVVDALEAYTKPINSDTPETREGGDWSRT